MVIFCPVQWWPRKARLNALTSPICFHIPVKGTSPRQLLSVGKVYFVPWELHVSLLCSQKLSYNPIWFLVYFIWDTDQIYTSGGQQLSTGWTN